MNVQSIHDYHVQFSPEGSIIKICDAIKEKESGGKLLDTSDLDKWFADIEHFPSQYVIGQHRDYLKKYIGHVGKYRRTYEKPAKTEMQLHLWMSNKFWCPCEQGATKHVVADGVWICTQCGNLLPHINIFCDPPNSTPTDKMLKPYQGDLTK